MRRDLPDDACEDIHEARDRERWEQGMERLDRATVNYGYGYGPRRWEDEP